MDIELRRQLLRALVRDRQFLKQAGKDVSPDDFESPEETLVAKAALTFYEKYEEPVGSMLRSVTDDLSSSVRLTSEKKKKLKELLDLLLGPQMAAVSVKALVDSVKNLKRSTFYSRAIDDILTAHEKGELDADVLSGLVERANRELNQEHSVAIDYFSDAELQKRIERRALWEQENKKYPLLMIDQLDEKIKAIGRRHLGLILAPYAAGKGMALVHLGVAYAMQGLNVLHITLEDPVDVVGDRIDANITGLAMNKLHRLPKRLKKRWKLFRSQLRGRIRIVDGLDGGWTVSRIERQWEQEKQNGFVADAIIVDYDDELECEKIFKGESARRFEFAEIYKRLRRMAARLDCIVWTAAQGTRGSEGKKVLSGKDTAEDISKIRKVFFAIGIGSDPNNPDLRHLQVLRHRLDKSRFGVDIMSDYSSAQFYDREATLKYVRAQRHSKP